VLCLLPTSANCAKNLGQNHFTEPNQQVSTFLNPIFICRVTYLLSTSGVALRFTSKIWVK
jgi:hypothetical protein